MMQSADKVWRNMYIICRFLAGMCQRKNGISEEDTDKSWRLSLLFGPPSRNTNVDDNFIFFAYCVKRALK